MITEPIHKTRVLPIRWFANWCNHLSSPFLMKVIHYDDHDYFGWEYKLNGIIYKTLNWPYDKWGTTHKVVSWEFSKEEAWQYFGVENEDDWNFVD